MQQELHCSAHSRQAGLQDQYVLHGAGCLSANAGKGNCIQAQCASHWQQGCVCALCRQAEGTGAGQKTSAACTGSTLPECAQDLCNVPSASRHKAKGRGSCMQSMPHAHRVCVTLWQAGRGKSRARSFQLMRQMQRCLEIAVHEIRTAMACVPLLQVGRRQRGRARRGRLQRQGLQMTARRLPWLPC